MIKDDLKGLPLESPAVAVCSFAEVALAVACLWPLSQVPQAWGECGFVLLHACCLEVAREGPSRMCGFSVFFVPNETWLPGVDQGVSCFRVLVCVHACTHMRDGALACKVMRWRPEVDIWISSLVSSSPLYLETGSPTEPGASVLARLAGQGAPGLLLSPYHSFEVPCSCCHAWLCHAWLLHGC